MNISLVGASVLTLACIAFARPVQAAETCLAPAGPDRAFHSVPMQRMAVDVDEDAYRVWSKLELWSFTKRATTIWQGTLPVCGGQVVVSQIINRQCSSASACPTRVVFRDGQVERVLLDYKQVCTLHPTFEMRGDIGELRACDEAVRLAAVRPD